MMEEIIKQTQRIQVKIKDGWEFSRGLLPDYRNENDGEFIPVLNADNNKRGMRKTIHTENELEEFLCK